MKKLFLITSLILALILPTDANALFFNGSTFVSVPIDLNVEPTNAVTIMAWFYSTSTLTEAIAGRATTTSIAGPYFIRKQGANTIRFGIRTTGADTALTSAAGTFSANRWTHVLGRYDGATMSIYINGASTTSVTKTGTLMGAGVETFPLSIGRYVTTTATPCGGCQIADVRVYNRALSPTEIKNYYYTGYASRVGLVQHLPLWSLPAVNLADTRRMGTTTGTGIVQSRLPYVAKYKK